MLIKCNSPPTPLASKTQLYFVIMFTVGTVVHVSVFVRVSVACYLSQNCIRAVAFKFEFYVNLVCFKAAFGCSVESDVSPL